MSGNLSASLHIRPDTEIKTGRELAAHAWLVVGDVTLFMGHTLTEELDSIDRLTDALVRLREERIEQQKEINRVAAEWKKGEAARM